MLDVRQQSWGFGGDRRGKVKGAPSRREATMAEEEGKLTSKIVGREQGPLGKDKRRGGLARKSAKVRGVRQPKFEGT